MKNKVLIIGCGALGSALGKSLSAKGHEVLGIKRTPTQLPFDCQFIDITDPNQVKSLPDQFNAVFFIVAPSQRSTEVYKSVYHKGLKHLLNHILPTKWFFVSSSSVYGQDKGERVDESSRAQPLSPTAQIIKEGENSLFKTLPQSTVIRFSGIYGPQRTYLLKKVLKKPTVQKTPPYFTNRIHEEDCIGFLEHLYHMYLAKKKLEPIYLATDQHPCSRWEIMNWLAQELKTEPPIPDIGKTQNKRCQSLFLEDVGYTFKYPSYKSGYAAILKSMGAV